jgi:GT2 family glycosyltransferase
MSKLTVSIVNYNAGEYLLKCLESLKKVSDEVLMDIWVVDNASTDNSIKRVQGSGFMVQIHYILNKENLGFGKAHNQVLKNLKSDYVLILNPDVEVEKGVLKYMISYMDENQNVGVSTCKILQSDEKLDWASHRGFPTPWASFKYYFLKDDSSYHMSDQDMEKTHEVDALSGSFFLTRKSVLEKVGNFDEDYFMYAEDIDLCYRIKEAGFKVMYVPEVKIIHHKGISSGLKKHSQGATTASLETRQRSLNAFYETMGIFYRKHLAKNYPFFINWVVYLGINLKWFLAKRKLTV